MATSDQFRRGMAQLRQAARHAMRTAAATGGGRRINVARRTNVIVSGNVGRDGAVHSASAVQHAPIHQDGGRERS